MAICDVGHVMFDNLLYQAEKLAGADTAGFEKSSFKAARKSNKRQYA